MQMQNYEKKVLHANILHVFYYETCQMKIVSVLDDCSILFSSSSVLPSFYLRYSFDSRSEEQAKE